MRNPALHLVGIAASPGGGGVFGTRAEEELRHWLEQRLDALGIDPVAYSRFVLSLLRRPDSAFTPPLDVATIGRNGGGGRRSKARPRSKLPLQGDREQRRAVVQCLTNAADQKCGVETLVDELCAKLRDLEGGDSKDEQEELKTATDGEAKVPFETLTPRDRALRYYAAFPALQPTTPKKFPHRKERNLSNNNNNNNNNYNNNNNNNNNNNKKSNGISSSNNNKTRQKKNKMSIQATESHSTEEKEDFGFVKSMEREREKEQELALDQLRLAQLQAKFDESLEALWDTGPGISQGTDSIWAAPSLSIPSGPLWPTDNADASFPIIKLEKNKAETPIYQESHIDDSPLIPWDVDLFSIEDYAEESGSKDSKTQDPVSWSDSARDGPWCWGGLGNIANLGRSPRTGSCFIPVVPCKSPVTNDKESIQEQKATSLPEPDEDLLTSARTHFRPIKEDGHWADGTTFPVNNNIERVTYRRSESGNLLYLPGGESPYMEYRESLSAPIAVPSNLTLKFRVRQCDKSIQTEPIRSPVKRRILSEQDRLYYSPNATEEANVNESDEMEKDFFDQKQVGWDQSMMLLRTDRKRRHSSNFKSRPRTVLRPFTL
ncbi:uncharacterized protein LOC100119957 isoform X2 [Nasonia vitripennis]|uniref:Uncharacterized protein n=1 Tax=Nasonia vitripennis TaxID=7425 RepID=A0A7M7R1G8_NASVI|nr:uncharacterized protein LOC100119957 isoform X2 [Nasonia vitripennis]XP_032456744.1 uncharacterized protein LOC100119957 isoform X2 [Nasonia vitripennis]XP_032456745.1 uncharacterized protein LOC100119957 isoform X2 [Nasonia vitripennis]XP_032456746.1 uncharacterized protein LOC100119957 isoform X2 [Nasonia vitripennis]